MNIENERYSMATIMKTETRGLIELGCWLALPIMVFLQLVNGPSVSDDQALIRILTLVCAIVGILYFRFKVSWN